MVPALEIEGLSRFYGRVTALEQVSFSVAQGELFALLGPNGAGKTTLVHTLCTLQRPDEGQVRIAGFDVVNQPVEARRQLGVVFQEPSLDTRLTVYENLDFHGRSDGVPAALRPQRIDQALKLVELVPQRNQLVRSLSGGMKRRLEIGRALVHQPRLLILDEPTVGLDVQTRSRMWEYIRLLRDQQGLTLLVTTHYIDEVEGCDRVCVIDHGKVLALDTPAALKQTYGREVLWIEPRDAAAAQEITAAYPQLLSEGGRLGLPDLSEAQLGSFYAQFGARLLGSRWQSPSLEDVFIALTGRAVRDQKAGGREAMLEFARQGGEHTR